MLPDRRRTAIVLGSAAAALVVIVVAIAVASRGGGSTQNNEPKPIAKLEPKPAPAVPPPSPPPAPPPQPAPPPVKPAVVAPAAPPPAPPPAVPAAPKSPTPRAPSTLGGKRVVVEYDNPAHRVEPVKPARREDEPGIAKARLMYNVGNQRLFAGNADGAVKAYRSSLSYFPGYVAGYRGLGLAYMQLGNNVEAVKALQTYVRAAPSAKDVALIKKRIASLQKSR